MMRVYKLTIEPLTSFRTPLQSDTIFGHLLWALRYLKGEGALLEFLNRYRDGEPPLLVSAGFPAGTLPVPVVGPPKAEEDEEQQPRPSLADKVVGDMLHKALEEDEYLPMAQWQDLAKHVSAQRLKHLRREASERLRHLREAHRDHPVTRTAVDRITGSAREGRLFVSMETFYGPGHKFDVWHKVDEADDELLGCLSECWRWVERNGFGRGKSRGHGSFRIERRDGQTLAPAGAELPHVDEPNGFVTLSAWVPKKDDPTTVTYRTRIKRGKLAEALAIPSPWKKPLLMLEPGALAKLEDGETVHEWYGRMVGDMHWVGDSVPEAQRQAVKNVVQYGYAFPLPVHVEESA